MTSIVYRMGASGYTRHQHFGLRKEWLQLYLDHPSDWQNVGHLGVRQIQSFAVWLKTLGLLDLRGKTTELDYWLRKADLDTPLPWAFLWVETAIRWLRLLGSYERWELAPGQLRNGGEAVSMGSSSLPANCK